MTVFVQSFTFNLQALSAELASIQSGFSAQNPVQQSRWVFLADLEITHPADQEAAVLAIVAAHQPQERTVKQKEVEAHGQRLVTLREQAAATSLDMDSDLSNVVQLRQMVALLMKKVAWLEAELQELRPPRPPQG